MRTMADSRAPNFRAPIDIALTGQTPGSALTQEILCAAVRNEIRDIAHVGSGIVSDEVIDWIVQSTLVQLGHGLLRCRHANLGYAGSIHARGEHVFTYLPFMGGNHGNAA